MDYEKAASIAPVHGLDELHSAPVRAVYSYWDSLRQGRRMPARRDFNPSSITPYLPLVGLIDVIDGGRDFRFRLLGSQVDEILQGSFTNTLVSDYPRPEGREHVMEIYRLCVTNRIPYLGTGQLGHLNKHYIVFENLTMPLSDDGETVSMLLTCNNFDQIRKQDG